MAKHDLFFIYTGLTDCANRVTLLAYICTHINRNREREKTKKKGLWCAWDLGMCNEDDAFCCINS